MDPTPYSYPAWEPITAANQDLSFRPSAYCDDNIRWFQAFAYRNDTSLNPGRTWCPSIARPLNTGPNNGANLAGSATDPVEFIYTGVPPGVLRKITITVEINEPLVAGDFNPTTSWFSSSPTPDGRPWGIAFTKGSTDTYSFKSSISIPDRRAYWNENQFTPQNWPLLWYGMRDFLPQVSTKIYEGFPGNPVYEYTVDMSDNGYQMDEGDRLTFYKPINTFAKVFAIYCRYEFSKREIRLNTPYFTSGSKSTVVP